MSKTIVIRVAALCLAACSADLVEGVQAQAFEEQQGTTLHGINLAGTSLAEMSMLGFRVHGATLSGTALTHVHVDRGEVIANRAGTTVRGLALQDAHVFAQVRNVAAGTSAVV